MKLLGDAQFGVCTFFGLGEESTGDKCGANGLPLTPSSIRMIGRFQKLKTLDHAYLSKYLDISRGKYERVYVISEYHRTNSIEIIGRPAKERSSAIRRLAYQLTSAISFLHDRGITNRYLCAENVSFNSKGDVQLSHYGLYYLTNSGADVSFPIGDYYYYAPELLATSSQELHRHSGPKSDVWSIGIILLEMILGCQLNEIWQKNDIDKFFKAVLGCEEIKRDDQTTFMDLVIRECQSRKKGHVIDLDEDLRDFVISCLRRLPSTRPTCKTLLEYNYVREFTLPLTFRMGLHSVFLCDNRAVHLSRETVRAGVDFSDESHNFPLRSRQIEEAYALWKLAGSNIETILKKKGLIKTRPPICCLPDVAVDEYMVYGREQERSYLTDLVIFPLSSDNLIERLKTIDIEAYFPVIHLKYPHDLDGNPSDDVNIGDGFSTDDAESSELPIVVKERDIGYQLQRIILLHGLIEAYPYKKALVWHEARIDIPPHYRAYVWAVLLDVRAGDADVIYKRIDKDTPTSTDRQIEVDIPRCHQYDELLSSPEGHAKFKRILKAWVATNSRYVYWQGLDSLCAPFLHLHFAYEALAFACLSNFIPKYLHNFFLKDNSAIIQEYLAVFNHLVAFHDPLLYSHLINIGFTPELYAIPWFLTMFAHVFPLHKLFHLWDTLLLGSNSFPLCVGAAVLVQLRDRLLEFGFNECILLFSDMPDVDIEQCVDLSIRLFRRTPASATYRKHMPYVQAKERGASFSTYGVDFTGPLGMEPLSVNELKRLHCPRICAHELLLLCGYVNDVGRNTSHEEPILVVDIRPSEEFARSAFPGSINLSDHLSYDGISLPSSPAGEKLKKHKGALIVVVGGKDDAKVIEFSRQLVFGGFERVCILNKGIDVLRHTNILVVPSTVDI